MGLKNRISLCMIVKNEEENLKRCLKHIHIFADQLIIIDTGSDDHTKEVAEKLGAEVYDFRWNDSFAEARNYSYSKAKCPWVMWLDADDIIDRENARLISKVKNNLKSSVDGVFFRRNLEYSQDGIPTQHHLFLYVTQNGKFKWKYRAYNSLNPVIIKDKYNYLKFENIHINHWFDTDRPKYRKTQTLKLLQKEDKNDPYILFALGEEYRSTGNFRKSVNSFSKYLKIVKKKQCNEDPHQIFLAHINIAKALFLQGKLKKMEKWLKKVINIYPEFSESWIMLGDHMFQKQKFEDAIGFYIQASKCNLPQIGEVAFDERLYTYYPFDMIGVAFSKLGLYKQALEYKNRAYNRTRIKDKIIRMKIKSDIVALEKIVC